MIEGNEVLANQNAKEIENEAIKAENVEQFINTNMKKQKGEKSLKAQLKQAEKTLEQYKKRNAITSVIQAQEAEVARLEKELEQSKSNTKFTTGAYVDMIMSFEVLNEKDGVYVDTSKKIAFIKNNRPLDRKKVDSFMALFAQGKYEDAYPIIVMEANKLHDAGYVVTDVNGNEIKEGLDEYYVILDGQHRATALMQLAFNGKENRIPNVFVKDIPAEKVGEYLVDINNVGTSWTTKDRMVVAALTSKEELYQNIAERITEGFNPSTAAKIYTKRTIPVKILNKILRGEDYELPKDAVVDIDRGNKFINICKAAGMAVTKITNRYYIGGFNAFAVARGDEKAFEALGNLVNILDEEMLKKVKHEDDFSAILREALESGREEGFTKEEAEQPAA